ncbi:MAG: class I SAM-dependent methyltransferase [archaeon]
MNENIEGSTIDLWKEIETNPTTEYREYFKEEGKFLEQISSNEKNILDLGCGDGRTLIFVSSFFNKVYGLDYDETAIKDCKKNVAELENVEIFLEDAVKTNFSNKFIDVVFIGLTFSNFGDHKFKILKEVKRILKDDGILAFSIYNEDAFDCRMQLYNKFVPNEIHVIDKKSGKVGLDNNAISEQFSKDEIKNILDETGFTIEKIQKGKIFYLIKCRKSKK